jgi:hypothetical protein
VVYAMTTHRLTRVVDIIRHWPFFHQGLLASSRYLRYDFDIETLRKTIFSLVTNPNAWVGIVLDNDRPLGFGMAHDVTPLFSPHKEYEVSLFYHQPGNEDATRLLQSAFESFCHTNNITRYYATTRRDSGAAIRCFQSPKYGFKRAYTVFVKTL